MNNANTHTGHNTTDDAVDIHPRVLTGALVLGLTIAVVVGAASFKLSFSTLLDLAVMTGAIDQADAWVIPVALDGPILACAVIRIALSQHTDAGTVRGRRLVVAVLAISAILSIVGNAYHAVLTSTALNAAVAAAIAALAPAMVLTMSEIVAVVLRAPRRRIAATTPPDSLASDPVVAPHPDIDVEGTETQTEFVAVDEDLDNGRLKPAVWASIDLWLSNPEWNNSDIARHLNIHTSTVGRHIKTWTEVQKKIASDRSIEIAPAEHERPNDLENWTEDDADVALNGHHDDAYTAAADDRDYVGAGR